MPSNGCPEVDCESSIDDPKADFTTSECHLRGKFKWLGPNRMEINNRGRQCTDAEFIEVKRRRRQFIFRRSIGTGNERGACALTAIDFVVDKWCAGEIQFSGNFHGNHIHGDPKSAHVVENPRANHSIAFNSNMEQDPPRIEIIRNMPKRYSIESIENPNQLAPNDEYIPIASHSMASVNSEKFN